MAEKDFCTLEELARRWGGTVTELLHSGWRGRGQGRVRICVRITGPQLLRSVMRKQTSSVLTDEVFEDFADDAFEASSDEISKGSGYREVRRICPEILTQDMPRGVYELPTTTLGQLEQPSDFPLYLKEAERLEDGAWWACTFDPPVNIELKHLGMLREDVERLDQLIGRVGSNELPNEGSKQPTSAPIEQLLSSPMPDARGQQFLWPWGTTHSTKLLQDLSEAARHWWSTYEPSNKSTAPLNDEVAAWLIKERKVAKRAADIMAQILRPDGLPPGPR